MIFAALSSAPAGFALAVSACIKMQPPKKRDAQLEQDSSRR